MGEPERRAWTVAEFLDWETRQPVRYELVNGQPVLMAGGTQAHSLIAVNILTALRDKLRGSGCRPGGADLRVVIPSGNVRFPDVTVDCGPFRPDANDASEPRVVFEILSKTTAWTDLHDKLRDYERTPSIQHYVIVSQDIAKIVVWTRGEHVQLVPGDDIVGVEAVVDLPAVGVTLPMAVIYEGVVD